MVPPRTPGTVTVPGMSVAHPARSAALQSFRSNADTVLSKLAVYSVSFAVSTWPALGPVGSPVKTPRLPHPDCTAALQVFASNTDQPFDAPNVVTYAVWVAWSTSTSFGDPPTSTVGGGVVGQAARLLALQVALLSIETSVSPALGM